MLDTSEWSQDPDESRLEHLRVAIQELASQCSNDTGSDSSIARLASIRQLIAALEGLWLGELATFDQNGYAKIAGWGSTRAFLTGDLHLSPAAAARAVHTCRALPDLPHTSSALIDGAISVEHAHVIALGTRDLPAEPVREAEPDLVRVAMMSNP